MAALFPSLINSVKSASNNLKTLATQLKQKFKKEADLIKQCNEVYKTSKAVISGVTSDLSGGLTPDAIAFLITNFDGNWDKFAESFDKLFNSNKNPGHTNMLEDFAKKNFGQKTFNIGSNIKNNGSDYLSLYTNSKTMVQCLLADVKDGDFPKLFNDFDKNWDKWADAVNTVFNNGSAQSQTNILETFAKNHFGANVFNAGSVIKNETPNILNALGTFKGGISSFGGSYRDPAVAIAKIQTGVDNIVKATEQMAKSLNNIVKLCQDPSNMQNAPGLQGLATLSNLSANKWVGGLQTVLKGGATVAKGIGQAKTIAGDINNLTGSLKQGDIKGTIAAGKKLANDVKSVLKNNPLKSAGTAAGAGNVANAGSAAGQSASSTAGTASQQQGNGSQSNSSGGNDDSYVCSGATMKCTFGSSSAKLSVYPDRTVYLTGQPMANITDHISMYNVAPFGRCKTTSYPPTGAATAAAHGRLTPMPCVPGTNSNWINGKNDVLVKGDPALLKSSYCRCCYGGIITITNDGQK